MTNNENTPRARKPKAPRTTAPTSEFAAEPLVAAADTTPVERVAPAAEPTTYSTEPKRGIGTGILIGAIAAALVGGLALGGAGGFVLANATHRTAVAEQGTQHGGPQGQGGGMPGQHPQGPPQGGGQQGPPQGGPQQGGQQQGDN